jgi:pimeloyl-ACP methyl ester carboxylesterase
MAKLVFEGPAGRLVADDRGSGPNLPVAFIHADGGNRLHWSAMLDHLALMRRAVALDLRGHGESEPPRDGDLSYAGRAADIGALLDRISAEKAVLVAHSGGAVAALTYAVAHPERVAGLLLVDPAGDPKAVPAEQREGYMREVRGPGYEALAAGYYGSIAGSNTTVRERVVADILATPKATVIGTMEALDAFEPERLVGKYRGPILVVVTPQTDQPWMLHRMGAGMPFRIVEGTGHWIHLDKPAEFNAILDEFLAGIDWG